MSTQDFIPCPYLDPRVNPLDSPATSCIAVTSGYRCADCVGPEPKSFEEYKKLRVQFLNSVDMLTGKSKPLGVPADGYNKWFPRTVESFSAKDETGPTKADDISFDELSKLFI